MLKGPGSWALCIRHQCSLLQTISRFRAAWRSVSHAKYKEKPRSLRATGVKNLMWFPDREPQIWLCAGLQRQVALIETKVELVRTLSGLHRQTEAARSYVGEAAARRG